MVDESEVAIVFADVVGSTQLYERLGDSTAREMVTRSIDIMRRATETSNGTVIKTIGDEVMSTFPTADDAMVASKKMQEEISTSPDLAHEHGHVMIRIGCHYGSVTHERRDIFGAAVHTANRMTSQAKAQQIVTTLGTVEKMSPEWRAMARQIDIATVRGKAEEVVLYEIIWQPDEATSMLPTVPMSHDASRTAMRLILEAHGQRVSVGQGRKSVTLGRSDDNDVVIKGNLISRVHARVESHRGRFTLVDESTNGTFIQPLDGDEVFVRRDSAVLTGEGVIGLGRAAQPGTSLAISYRIDD